MSTSLLCRYFSEKCINFALYHPCLHQPHLQVSSFRHQRRPKSPIQQQQQPRPTTGKSMAASAGPPLPASTVVEQGFHSLDSPPVLFIQKYERLVDVGLLLLPSEQHGSSRPQVELEEDAPSEMEKNTALSEETLTQRKIKFILKTVSQAKSFEMLEEVLRKKPEPLFSPPLKSSGLSDSIFVDEEAIRNSGIHSMKLESSDDLLKWTDTKLQLRKLPTYYLMLSKARLTLLVCSTTAAGYGLAPGAFDPTILAISTLGVCLISSAANAVNQYLEVPFDSQMNRTKNRVLVRGYLSSLHAITFAAVTAITGTFLLAHYVNGMAAALGVANLVLYTCVYTPMKRVSILNTWIGSVVGAIPPLIGWASATGGLDAGALVLGGILFAWQFPHFNSLSWNLRPDYSKAGYRMMSVTDPGLCRRVALRYSLGCVAICSAAPVLEVTDLTFALDSLPLNLYLVYLAWRFHQKADSSTSRKLFRYTLIHLPLLMTLMFISKKKERKDDELTAPTAESDTTLLQKQSSPVKDNL